MAGRTLAAHEAGLQRLSTRAAAGPLSASASPRHGLHSFAPLAAAVLAHLRAFGVAVVPRLPGLTELELARAEAELGFAFPLDLHTVLATAPLGARVPGPPRRCSCPLLTSASSQDSCLQLLDPRALLLSSVAQHGEAAATPCARRSVDTVCGGAAPRWIELWSDAASDRRRDSSSSEASTAYPLLSSRCASTGSCVMADGAARRKKDLDG